VSERAARVAISGISGLGPARFRKLLDAFGWALVAVNSPPDEIEAAGVSPELAEQLSRIPMHLEQVETEILALDEQGVRCLTWGDDAYPHRLLRTASPPPVLWWSGVVEPNMARSVAVVGSREVTEEAVAWAGRAGELLSGAGIAVISGLAAGIDAAAHEGALEAGGLTVGVCGCGIATALNTGRAGLAGRVAEAGAVCSELSPSAPLLPRSLFARDRIIAGLADAVIVVESHANGGAVHTAKFALQEGRPVFVVEGPDMSSGNRQLLAEGANRLDPEGDLVPAITG
jgi:DNA processing protein